MTYDIGDLIELRATFTDPDTGKQVDPDTVVCTVKAPSGIVSTPRVSRADGVWNAYVEPDKSGRWSYSFDGSGGYIAAGEGRFTVRRQLIPRV